MSAVHAEGPAAKLLDVLDPLRLKDRLENERLKLVLAFTLHEHSNCVDIGANKGEVLANMVRLAPQGHHVAFEPIPELSEQLGLRFPEVEVHQIALSDREDRRNFTHVTSEPGWSGFEHRPHLGPQETSVLSVNTNLLDNILPETFVPSFVKIDVEGAELQVFRGALETLRRHRPVVWFEHLSDSASYYGTSSGELFRLLADDCSMRIFRSDGDGPLDQTAFEACACEPDNLNFFAQ